MPARKAATARAARASEGNNVDAFLATLEHPLAPEIEAVRALILGADARVREDVKWNAPSFYIEEHFATFKLRPMNTVQVVFHTGAKVRADAKPLEIHDPSDLLKWAAKDRCVATFADMRDIEARGTAFVRIVQQWIEQLPDGTR